MNTYITKSLAHWKTRNWSIAEMEALFRAPENESILRLSIHQGQAILETGRSSQAGRTAPIQAYFTAIASRCPDLATVLYICTDDHPEQVIPGHLPFFTFAKTLSSHFIVIPDQFFTHDFSRYHRASAQLSLDADVDEASRKFPWPAKKAQAVFRSKDFKYAEICAAALSMSGAVDAKIASPPEQCAPRLKQLCFEELADEYPEDQICGQPLDIGGQVAFKYLLHTPACWDSTYWKLRSNSLLFSLTKLREHSKDSTPLSTHQWYAYFMEPFRHFIPCTLDDLAEKIAWAQAHDQEARAIAEEGSRLARHELTHEKSLAHVSGLVRAFSEIMPS